MSTTPAIEVKGLSRRFGDCVAVENASFAVPAGHVVGFVGANGAGKTTTMRILATLDTPTKGRAAIRGYDTIEYPHEVRRLLGWMPDDYGTYSDMTGREYLDFFARAYGYKGNERVERVNDIVEFCELQEIANRYIDKLSKGMGQRLCLGRALIHDPEILIMDEPAAGLDPRARIDLKNLIRVLADSGKTVLISSHILSELGEMCDSLLFINKGKIIHHGDAEDLVQDNGGREGEKSFTTLEVQIIGTPEKLEAWTEMTPGVEYIEATKHGARIKAETTDREELAKLLKRLIDDGHQVVDFHRQERRLEEAFVDIVNQESA